MPNLNQCNLMGHVTREVELRTTPNKTAVATIGLAINRKWEDNLGREKSEVVFVDVVAWARLAEICNEYLLKGDPVFFSGRLRQESWLDKETQQKRSKLVVVAESMQLLTSKGHTKPLRPTKPTAPASDAHAAVNEVFPDAHPIEQEVPF